MNNDDTSKMFDPMQLALNAKNATIASQAVRIVALENDRKEQQKLFADATREISELQMLATNIERRAEEAEAQVKALTAERDAQVWIAKLAYAERDVARGLHAEACKERDAQAEAVRVLGEECRVYRMHVGLCNAVDSRGRIVLSRLQRGTVASNLWDDAVRAVRNNHIARAAVEGKETQ